MKKMAVICLMMIISVSPYLSPIDTLKNLRYLLEVRGSHKEGAETTRNWVCPMMERFEYFDPENVTYCAA